MKRIVLVKGLYCITDSIDNLEDICKGKADIVQLRVKNISDREIFLLGKRIKEIVKRYNVLFFINDRIDIALSLGADGVHVGQDDLPVKELKRLLRGYSRIRNFIIGVSTHSISEAIQAEKDGADYISFGPIFKSPTKPELKPVGLDLLKEVRQKVKIPVVAIGGINEKNIEEIKKTGVNSVAVISAISRKQNIEDAVRNLKTKLL
ncbi:MAG: thiamine phosphate synthase [Endomicrobiia bacterium]